MAPPERILIIRPSALGDVCRSVPLAAAIRKHRPGAEIHWLVNAPYAPVIEAHPAIDQVIPFDRKALGKQSSRLNLVPILGFLRSLRSQRYCIVIDAQGLARSGLFAFATGARLRTGHADARELGWLGLNKRITPTPGEHTVDRMMSLLAPLGINEPEPDMHLYAREADKVWRDSQPELREPFIVFAPTSLWPAKRWPIERFTELARLLLHQGHRIVVVGAPGEERQCAPLLLLASEGLPVIDLVGKTSVGQMLAVIEKARLVLANDSAALHMAVGFNRPIVGLFGPTRTEIVGPYRKPDAVIQHVSSTDHLDYKDDSSVELIGRIRVDEVHERINGLLRQTPETSPHVPAS